jgi:hypothetical protein
MAEQELEWQHEGLRVAEVVRVIRTVAIRGHGTEQSPMREVVQFWDLGGTLLAEKDWPADSPGFELRARHPLDDRKLGGGQ